MTALPDVFLNTPIAHRGLHDIREGRPENSIAAAKAAIRAGYGIELDIQASRDFVPMVFHDYDMTRLTGNPGAIHAVNSDALSKIGLIGNKEPIPTLAEFLEVVDGQVPLLIEIKDQDGAMGPNVGPLELEVARVLGGYTGPVAVMSFNPHSVAALAKYAPEIPRGLTTESWAGADVEIISQTRRDELRQIGDFKRVGASFISHEASDLERPVVSELKGQGVPILCWTVRSAEQEERARRIADNITFEGYLPKSKGA